MRQPPPHNVAQAFEEQLEERATEYRRNGFRAQPLPGLDTLSPADWTQPPPPYDWIVDGCFLRGTVAMLSGDGGLGKSLLMQQLCTAAALGQDWLGLETKGCNSLAFFCEDDVDELRRRQAAINRQYGCEPADLAGKVHYAARVGQENVLVEFDRRTDEPKYLPLLEQLRATVVRAKAQIVVLDTLADVFAGNEIIRNQVRRFVTALRKLALEVQGVVILTAHPSLTGMNSGTGLSGSTGWNNSVRSRLYLTRPKVDENEEEDTNERLLKTMKNNQGPYGGRIKLRWEDGVFTRAEDRAPGVTGTVETLRIDGAVTDAVRYLIKRGTRVAADPLARTSLVNLAKTLPSCRDYRRADLESSQLRLVERGRLVTVTMGPPSRRYAYLRTPDTTYPGEEGNPESASSSAPFAEPSQPSQP